jgi:type VI secretion system protein ImpF
VTTDNLHPSLLDILLDGRVRGRSDGPDASRRRMDLRQMRRAIERDIEMLLCTRQRHLVWPPSLDALFGSIVNYGIVDRSGTNLTSDRSKEELRRSIETTIKAFEPRLTNVTVRLVKPREGEDRRLRFQIEGQTRFDSEPITLNSTLDPVMRIFSVQSSAERS